MLGPIRSLSNVHITLQNGYASAERIFDKIPIVNEKFIPFMQKIS